LIRFWKTFLPDLGNRPRFSEGLPGNYPASPTLWAGSFTIFLNEEDILRFVLMKRLNWAYMKHLRDNYPYLFSLTTRMNPFDPNASPIVL
jgi:hypothetical protein